MAQRLGGRRTRCFRPGGIGRDNGRRGKGDFPEVMRTDDRCCESVVDRLRSDPARSRGPMADNGSFYGAPSAPGRRVDGLVAVAVVLVVVAIAVAIAKPWGDTGQAAA